MRVVVVFASANSPTAPVDEPLCPDVIRSHGASLDAVQLHPFSVCRLDWREPPPKLTETLEGLHVYRHAAADWSRLTLCPPTLNVAVRTDGRGFASTVYGIDASPWPFDVVIETQLALDPIDQVQSRVAVMVSVP
jgi:hypothetical protein